MTDDQAKQIIRQLASIKATLQICIGVALGWYISTIFHF